MPSLQDLEQKYQFTLPLLYHRLAKDNMLSHQSPHADWVGQILPTLASQPPFLLFALDYEPLSIDDIAFYYQELKDPNDYRKIDAAMQFIPFAKTGAGDLYTFYTHHHAQEASVVLLSHDEENAVILAKNLQDFAFRSMLEAVVELDEYSLLDDLEQLHTNLNAWLNTHRPYLSEAQSDCLDKIFNREVKTYLCIVNPKYSYEFQGLLSHEECKMILQEMIHFQDLDLTFKYMQN